MVCTDPTGHVRVLMIVVVCVCRLSEEYACGVGVYVCGCPGRWDRGMFSAVIICIVDFL